MSSWRAMIDRSPIVALALVVIVVLLVVDIVLDIV
jgi:hypothetical protein